MIAKIVIQLPYAIMLPENENYNIYQYEVDGYSVNFLPFLRSEYADRYSDSKDLTINSIKAFSADLLQVIFTKDSFDRNPSSEFDPPLRLIEEVANDFLLRLRYVTNAFQIKPINLMFSSLSITYLKDDGSELIKDDKLLRKRFGKKYNFSFIAVTKEVWDDVHSIDPFQPLPVWKNLLMDATYVLPDIGPSIVLIFTALEVFISKILDDVARHIKINEELWGWINNRGFFLKNPSIEEQFDFLCKNLLGRSLKDNNRLWESFKNIQTARNSFAHSGIAKIGEEQVNESKTKEFIIKANQIINYIKEVLPEELKWQEFNHEIRINALFPIS